MLSKTQAIEAVRILDTTLQTRRVWQNKRKGYRDLKWDYLREDKAKRASKALKAAGIDHRYLKVNGIGPWSGGEHSQIRLEVDFSFSLGDARERNRGGKPKKRAKPPSARERWNADKRQLAQKLALLNFGAPYHRSCLTEALRALRLVGPIVGA